MIAKTLLIIGLLFVMVLLNMNAFLIAFYGDAAYPTAGLYHLPVIFFLLSLMLLWITVRWFHPIGRYQDFESVDSRSLLQSDLVAYLMIGFHGVLWLILLVLSALSVWVFIDAVIAIILWVVCAYGIRNIKRRYHRMLWIFLSHLFLLISLSVDGIELYLAIR